MTVRVDVVDPADDARYGAWFAVIDASGQALWPGRPGWQPAELRAPALDPAGPQRTVLLGARDGAATVGAAMVELPRHDNAHLAQLTVEVHPAHRRGGVGRALLAAAEGVAVDDGRRVVFGWQEQRLPAPGQPAAGQPAPGQPSPGQPAPGHGGFAAVHGYAMVLENLRRELAVPLDPGLVDRLEAAAAPHAADYRVGTFEDAWPAEWLADRADFGRHMSTDAPLGDWQVREEAWDPSRVRDHERLVDGMGRQLLVAVAVERATERPVAFTELTVSRAVPEIAYQWDTLVLPGHRGHRLGMLVKLANLRRLQARFPATRLVVTWNASTNDPMIAVNDALGCRVVSVGRTWQKTVGRQAGG